MLVVANHSGLSPGRDAAEERPEAIQNLKWILAIRLSGSHSD